MANLDDAVVGGSQGGSSLTQREEQACRYLVSRILDEIPTALVEASLFGSKARRTAREDSDVDILLIFGALSPSREPEATHAERIADEVASETGVPVTVWSVSVADLACGYRTPMLVDALYDAVPIWCSERPIEPVEFTSADANRCAAALLDRVAEGSVEFGAALAKGASAVAARRARDDLVRLCTALLLLEGITWPRRARAVRMAVERCDLDLSPSSLDVLDWVIESFGEDGRDEARDISPPPFSSARLTSTIDRLARRVGGRMAGFSPWRCSPNFA